MEREGGSVPDWPSALCARGSAAGVGCFGGVVGDAREHGADRERNRAQQNGKPASFGAVRACHLGAEQCRDLARTEPPLGLAASERKSRLCEAGSVGTGLRLTKALGALKVRA